MHWYHVNFVKFWTKKWKYDYDHVDQPVQASKISKNSPTFSDPHPTKTNTSQCALYLDFLLKISIFTDTLWWSVLCDESDSEKKIVKCSLSSSIKCRFIGWIGEWRTASECCKRWLFPLDVFRVVRSLVTSGKAIWICFKRMSWTKVLHWQN